MERAALRIPPSGAGASRTQKPFGGSVPCTAVPDEVDISPRRRLYCQDCNPPVGQPGEHLINMQ
jgi:hypothetical protein